MPVGTITRVPGVADWYGGFDPGAHPHPLLLPPRRFVRAWRAFEAYPLTGRGSCHVEDGVRAECPVGGLGGLLSRLTGRLAYVGLGMATTHECGASIPGAIWLSCISCRSGPAGGPRVPAPDTYHLSLTGIPLVTWYFAIGICHGCFLTCL